MLIPYYMGEVFYFFDQFEIRIFSIAPRVMTAVEDAEDNGIGVLVSFELENRLLVRPTTDVRHSDTAVNTLVIVDIKLANF